MKKHDYVKQSCCLLETAVNGTIFRSETMFEVKMTSDEWIWKKAV